MFLISFILSHMRRASAGRCDAMQIFAINYISVFLVTHDGVGEKEKQTYVWFN